MQRPVRAALPKPFPIVTVLAGCLLSIVSSATLSRAERRVVEVAGTAPSVGPGRDRSLLRSEWAEVEVEDAGVPAAAPTPSLVVEEPSPLTPTTVLGFDGVDGTPKGSPVCCIYKPPDTHIA